MWFRGWMRWFSVESVCLVAGWRGAGDEGAVLHRDLELARAGRGGRLLFLGWLGRFEGDGGRGDAGGEGRLEERRVANL